MNKAEILKKCYKCGEEILIKKNLDSGKWLVSNTDGSSHYPSCKETLLKTTKCHVCDYPVTVTVLCYSKGAKLMDSDGRRHRCGMASKESRRISGYERR